MASALGQGRYSRIAALNSLRAYDYFYNRADDRPGA